MSVSPVGNVSGSSMFQLSDATETSLGDIAVRVAAQHAAANAQERTTLVKMQAAADGTSPVDVLKETMLHNKIIEKVTVLAGVVRRLLTVPEILNR